MQVVLCRRETTNGTLATGLLLGLWIGEVLAAAEYWALRVLSFGVRSAKWLLRWPTVIAFVAFECYALLHPPSCYFGPTGRARTAILDEKAIANAAQLYRLDTGRWPATLNTLVPRYLKELHADPWGRDYVFYGAEGGIAVLSAGPDRETGTPDDIVHVAPQH
jgi:hypothetical protein